MEENDNIYEIILKRNYDLFSNELNETNAREIKKHIKILRESYKSNVPITNYDEKNICKAYMLCYYPNYVEPIYILMKNYICKTISKLNITKFQVTFLGAGPGPEVYGCIKAIKENTTIKKIQCNLHDYEQNWQLQRDVTRELIMKLEGIYPNIKNIFGCNFQESCERTCDKWINCKEKEFKGDVIVMQNCINHMKDIDYFKKILIEKIEVMKKGAYFIIIDLQYDNVRNVLQYLKESTGGYMNVIASGSDVSTSKYIMPKGLKTYIFDGTKNFIAKKNTRYNYIILQRK